MIALVLFPVTIHLENEVLSVHRFSLVQFEEILEDSLMHNPQEMIHPCHRLLLVLPMLCLLDLLLLAFHDVVFDV